MGPAQPRLGLANRSTGNFRIYDPTSKILYSDNLGAPIGAPYMIVPDFEDHIHYMERFHPPLHGLSQGYAGVGGYGSSA